MDLFDFIFWSSYFALIGGLAGYEIGRHRHAVIRVDRELIESELGKRGLVAVPAHRLDGQVKACN